MSSLESSKNLAGIGAILLLLGFVPGAGIVIGIIGVTLLLTGIKGLATYYQDHEIYQDALTGVIFYIIALIAIGIALISLIFGGIFSGLAAGLLGLVIGLLVFIAGLIIAFIFYLLAAIRLRRAFSALAQKTGEHMFETAGFILYLGAILTIIVVGLALILVAWILVFVAFFSVRVPSQPYAYGPPPTPTTIPPNQATRYCPNCGAPVAANATFCPNCGKQLPPA